MSSECVRTVYRCEYVRDTYGAHGPQQCADQLSASALVACSIAAAAAAGLISLSGWSARAPGIGTLILVCGVVISRLRFRSAVWGRVFSAACSVLYGAV
jgi:hypothetical protein